MERKCKWIFYLLFCTNKKKIVAYVEIERIDEDTPHNLWKKYKEIGGINEKEFFEYFKDKTFAYGILIKNIYKFSNPICPYKEFVNFKAPQSFIYADINSLTFLMHSSYVLQ